MYNECPDDELKVYIEARETLRKTITKALTERFPRARTVYFPGEEKWSVFNDETNQFLSGMHRTEQQAVSEALEKE